MSGLQATQSINRLTVDSRRLRQTPDQPSAFGQVLRGGAQALLTGAATATRLVGLPTLSAAISRVDVDTGPAAATPTVGGEALSPEQLQQTLHQQRVGDDLKLLALQDEIQRHNRQISLVSNVLKSRHDTSKAAIGNMRS